MHIYVYIYIYIYMYIYISYIYITYIYIYILNIYIYIYIYKQSWKQINKKKFRPFVLYLPFHMLFLVVLFLIVDVWYGSKYASVLRILVNSLNRKLWQKQQTTGTMKNSCSENFEKMCAICNSDFIQ